MNTQVIINKFAGQVIPRGYLQEALKHCPTYVGMAIQDKTEGEPLLDVSSSAKTMDVDELFKLVEGCKDVPLVLALGNMTQDFDTSSDMLPYVFQQRGDDEELQDILAIFLEGDFPNYSKPGDGHTDEYNLWENFLYPTITEKFEASADLPEFFNRIRSSQFEQAVLNTTSHRGVAVLVPLEGDIIAFGKNDIGGEFTWGTTSNTFGWGSASKLEKAAEAVVTVAKKSMSRLQRLQASTAVATNVTPAAPAKEEKVITEDQNGVKHISEKDDVWSKWPGTSSKTHTMKVVPDGLQGNARNAWIRLFTNNPTGELPKAKDQRGFAVPVPNELIGFAQEKVSTKDDVKKLQSRVNHFLSPAIGGGVSAQMAAANAQPVTEEPGQVQDPKKTRPAEQPAGDNRPSRDFLPELSADDKKGAVLFVTEIATNPKAPEMLEIQKIESKWPKFSEMMGIKFEDMGRWTIADIKHLGKKYPDALALAFVESRRMNYELGAFEKAVNTEAVNDKDTRVPAKPATEQVVVPPAGHGTAPAGKKKSRLQQLTGAGQAA